MHTDLARPFIYLIRSVFIGYLGDGEPVSARRREFGKLQYLTTDVPGLDEQTKVKLVLMRKLYSLAHSMADH